MNKDKLIDLMKYYRIPQFFIFAIFLYIIKAAMQNAAATNLNYAIIQIFIPGIWILAFLYSTRGRRYRKLTGRNYYTDHGKYNRTYNDLVEYFKFKNADPHHLDTDIFPEQDWHNLKGFIFGIKDKRPIYIPSNCESNIAVFGPPASGKTAGLAIINAMHFNGSVLAVDIKGDIYNYVSQHSNRKIIRFCPDDPDAIDISCHFDPLAGISDMSSTDRKLFIDEMSTILIPDEGGTDGNFFTNRARKYFQGVTHLLLYKDSNTSFPDIIHAILEGDAFVWVTEARSSECIEAKELLSSFYGSNEKNVSGAYDTLCSALTPFSNSVLDELLIKSNNCISIKSLENGYDVYLQIAQEHLDAYAPIFTLLIQSFSTAFTKRPDSSTGVKNRPILMLLDEFPQLTFNYKMINSNLSTLRSKSVVICLIQQNMAQLEYRYKPEGTRSIIGNCNYQVILGSNDINSSKTFCEMFGKHKVLKICNSITKSDKSSTGRSVQETEEYIFSPNHFGDLPSNKKMVVYFKGKYCELQKLNCYTD